MGRPQADVEPIIRRSSVNVAPSFDRSHVDQLDSEAVSTEITIVVDLCS